MQITLDVATLTAVERLHIVQFITNYPALDNFDSADYIEPIPAFSFPAPEDEEDPIPSPEVAFGPTLVPLPPVIISATFIPPPPPVAATTGVTLDKSGLPWDERIHSSNKAFVADGTWRKRRGVEDALIAQVEGELKAVMGIPASSSSQGSFPSAVATPPVPTAIASVPPPPPPIPVVAATTTAQATVSAPPPPPVVPAASSPNAYLNLIQLVTDVVTKKQLTKAQVEELIAGVDPSLNLQLLSKRPDLIPQIAANIRTLAA